jgi:hypothetical protein
MKARLSVVFVLAATLLTVAGPLFAHHGTAAYDTGKQVTVKGTVTDFEFVNPHVMIVVNVLSEDGTTQRWQGELTSPNHLARAGWTKSSLQPMQQVTITGFSAKNGNSIWIQKIVLADGRELALGTGD